MKSCYADSREGCSRQVFRAFFHVSGMIDERMAQLLPQAPPPPEEKKADILRRVAEALGRAHPVRSRRSDEDNLDFDAVMTASDREIFHHKDFETMSAEQLLATDPTRP